MTVCPSRGLTSSGLNARNGPTFCRDEKAKALGKNPSRIMRGERWDLKWSSAARTNPERTIANMQRPRSERRGQQLRKNCTPLPHRGRPALRHFGNLAKVLGAVHGGRSGVTQGFYLVGQDLDLRLGELSLHFDEFIDVFGLNDLLGEVEGR